MEANRLIDREVHQTFPPTVLYTITEHGRSLEKVLDELHYWGLAHRVVVIGEKKLQHPMVESTLPDTA